MNRKGDSKTSGRRANVTTHEIGGLHGISADECAEKRLMLLDRHLES